MDISPNNIVRFSSVSNQDKGLQIVPLKNYTYPLSSIIFAPELHLQCQISHPKSQCSTFNAFE